MVRPASLLTGLALLTLSCMPIMYAIRTLIGMKRKDPYPLLRVRLDRWDSCTSEQEIGASVSFLK
jgi:hypothetical protein